MPTWISLAFAVITGLTLLFTYLLGDKRKLRKLKARQYELEKQLRDALAANDTVHIATIGIELDRMREQISSLGRK